VSVDDESRDIADERSRLSIETTNGVTFRSRKGNHTGLTESSSSLLLDLYDRPKTNIICGLSVSETEIIAGLCRFLSFILRLGNELTARSSFKISPQLKLIATLLSEIFDFADRSRGR